MLLQFMYIKIWDLFHAEIAGWLEDNGSLHIQNLILIFNKPYNEPFTHTIYFINAQNVYFYSIARKILYLLCFTPSLPKTTDDKIFICKFSN